MRTSTKHLWTIGLSGVLLAACGYDNGGAHRDVYTTPDQSSDVAYQGSIDANATMTDINPGQGLGMMIEYTSGGTWHVMFTCDTAKTNLSCNWSIDAYTLDGSDIGGIDVQNLDSDDAVTPDPKTKSAIHYDGITTTELDEFSFQANAGNPVEFYVWLSDEPEPYRYVFWIGDGWMNKGISGPYFDLTPNSP